MNIASASHHPCYDYFMPKRVSPEALGVLQNAFERSVEELEKRMGLEIKDKNALYSALTHKSYRSDLAVDPATRKTIGNNESLEKAGNKLLNELIRVMTAERNIKYLSPVLISNLVFSRIALTFRMNEVIRAGRPHAEMETPETRIRILANCFEAVMAVVGRSANGTHKVREFLEKHFFSDIFVDKLLPMLMDESSERAAVALAGLTDGRARLSVNRENNKYIGRIFYEDREVSIEESSEGSASRAVITVFLKLHPEFVWGYEGDVGIHYPQVTNLRHVRGKTKRREPPVS